MLTAQEHAQAYWATRPVKKWVVTVQGGGAGSIAAWKREVYVSARDGGRAIRCAREQALFPSPPRGVAAHQSADALDAARYLWLRDNGGHWGICEWTTDEPDGIGYYRDARAASVVDAAIDAAMAKEST